MIVQELHAIQKAHGYLPTSELKALSERTATPLYRLQEVASFFPHFRRTRPPAVQVQVCRDMTCRLRGASALRESLDDLKREFGAEKLSVDGVSCLGRCDRAPAVLINEELYVERSAAQLQDAVRQTISRQAASPDHDATIKRQSAAPWKIDVYTGQPRYEAVKKYIARPNPQELLDQLKLADLRGMGGAGAWAYQKWSDVWKAAGTEKYIVCNADESEPGTFKDRELLLRTPHLVLEGVILAGLMTGATRGYIYIRHEYHEQIEIMRRTIAQAEQAGVCGRNVLSSGRAFPVEVFVSPGGYICGEQSALIEAMEDHRAEPRNRPPQLETNGLYDKPTLLSNVETFAWTPGICIHGGAWYRNAGVRGCLGMRFFSISGDVNRPGAYEVPNGITLRELIDDYAEGMREGRALAAFAPSGPSAGFLPPRLSVTSFPRAAREKFPAGTTHLDILDLELDLQRFRDLGLMLGAGLVVYAEGTDLMEQAVSALEFFRNESCGKCVPCRLGSQKLTEMSHRLRAGELDQAQLESMTGLVRDLSRTMEMTSICGLGMVASAPLVTLLTHFPVAAAERK